MDKNPWRTAQQAKTMIQAVVEEVRFVWTIENFGILENGKTITTLFSSESNQWQLEFTMDTITSVCLVLLNLEPGIQYYVSNEVSILDSDYKQSTGKVALPAKSVTRIPILNVQRNILTDCTNGYLKNNCLRFGLKLLIHKDFEITTVNWPILYFEKDLRTADFSEFLASGTLSDVKIVTSDPDSVFLAHKLILSANSKVFAAMFQHDTKENQENVVTIENIKPEIIRLILDMMYSGQLNLKLLENFETAKEVLQAADQYEIVQLRILSEHALIRTLSNSNAFEFLIFGDKFEDRIKQHAIRHIVHNKRSIIGTEDWEEFTLKYPKMANEILIEAMKV